MSIRLRGRVITPERILDDGVVVVEGDRITSVRRATAADDVAPSGQVVLPGLVDVHCHGGGGASFTRGDPDEIAVASRHHRRQGTTSLVGSAVTDAPEAMLKAVDLLARAVDDGALVAVHAEGPFLSATRCGAQDPAHLRAPDAAFADELVAAGRGHLKVMTVAPELPGADELAARLASQGVIAAVGHTGAGAGVTERFLRAQERGLVTHLFNGMPPLHHRAPGAAAGALTAAARGFARVELIADGVHLADDLVALVFAVLGPERVVLVTDAMAAAGMPDGAYTLGPRDVRVRNGVARLVDGDSIAGGTSRLLDIVRRQLAAGLDPAAVVASASAVPAAALGLGDVGALTPGLLADVIVTDPDLRPVTVLKAGVRVG